MGRRLVVEGGAAAGRQVPAGRIYTELQSTALREVALVGSGLHASKLETGAESITLSGPSSAPYARRCHRGAPSRRAPPPSSPPPGCAPASCSAGGGPGSQRSASALPVIRTRIVSQVANRAWDHAAPQLDVPHIRDTLAQPRSTYTLPLPSGTLHQRATTSTTSTTTSTTTTTSTPTLIT